MEQRKVTRLNTLFEKMVSSNVNVIERRELNHLYNEYIDDGRDKPRKSITSRSKRRSSIN